MYLDYRIWTFVSKYIFVRKEQIRYKYNESIAIEAFALSGRDEKVV